MNNKMKHMKMNEHIVISFSLIFTDAVQLPA
jgi:hypothetical protein